LSNFLFFRRLQAAQDDILAAEVFDQLLRLEAGAFANRQHRDDRTDAKHDAQHRQQRAQPVQPQALVRQPKRAAQAGGGEAREEADGGAARSSGSGVHFEQPPWSSKLPIPGSRTPLVTVTIRTAVAAWWRAASSKL